MPLANEYDGSLAPIVETPTEFGIVGRMIQTSCRNIPCQQPFVVDKVDSHR